MPLITTSQPPKTGGRKTESTPLLRNWLTAATLGAFCSLPAFTLGAEEDDSRGPAPYNFNTQTWMQPFAAEGFSWGGTSGVYVESTERIFVLQRGETQLPSPVPSEYTNFAGSLGWNVLRGRGRVWQNCLYVINADGELLEVWDQWDHLFTGTDGPGPHRIRMSPYDNEKRLWLIDETGHIIYVF
jgi:hypothetical protein